MLINTGNMFLIVFELAVNLCFAIYSQNSNTTVSDNQPSGLQMCLKLCSTNGVVLYHTLDSVQVRCTPDFITVKHRCCHCVIQTTEAWVNDGRHSWTMHDKKKFGNATQTLKLSKNKKTDETGAMRNKKAYIKHTARIGKVGKDDEKRDEKVGKNDETSDEKASKDDETKDRKTDKNSETRERIAGENDDTRDNKSGKNDITGDNNNDKNDERRDKKASKDDERRDKTAGQDDVTRDKKTDKDDERRNKKSGKNEETRDKKADQNDETRGKKSGKNVETRNRKASQTAEARYNDAEEHGGVRKKKTDKKGAARNKKADKRIEANNKNADGEGAEQRMKANVNANVAQKRRVAFKMLPMDKTWVKARHLCKKYGWTLAMPKTKGDVDDLHKYLRENTFSNFGDGKAAFWFGLSDTYRNNTFFWIDGEPADHTSFELRTMRTKAHCGLMKVDSKLRISEWLIERCSRKWFAICEEWDI